MNKSRDLVEAFENSMVSRQRADYRRNMAIFEALYREARLLGVLPLKDPLDGIDVDVRLAQVINARKSS
jgi:hypothetical protein